MRVDHTRLRPDPTSTSTHGAEAAQPLLRLFRPHREHKAVSVRLLRPHRGRKAVSALSRCAVSHLASGAKKRRDGSGGGHKKKPRAL